MIFSLFHESENHMQWATANKTLYSLFGVMWEIGTGGVHSAIPSVISGGSGMRFLVSCNVIVYLFYISGI